MQTRIYKDEFKDWCIGKLKDLYPYSEGEKQITLFKTTEDIYNCIHSVMFEEDDEKLQANVRKLVCFPVSNEIVITFND